jgi:Ca2+-binding EF-hand superfamily protein
VHGFAIVATQFETLMGIKPEVSAYVDIQTLFEVLDNDNDGRIDGLEFLGGVGLICRGSLEDKARFCFELYDFNLNSSLSLQEMVVMMQSSVCGMLCLTGGMEDNEPELSDFERLGLDAFKNADGNSDGSITFDEFLKWARTSRDIMEYLDKIARTAEQSLEDADTDDSASDISEDCAPEMFEIWPQPIAAAEAEAKTTAATTVLATAYHNIDADGVHGERSNHHAEVLDFGMCNELFVVVPSRVLPNSGTLMEAASVYDMHGFRFPSSDGEQPDSNLELEHVHGYSCCSSRNSVFFTATMGSANDYILATASAERAGASIVYPAAAIGAQAQPRFSLVHVI